MIDHFPTGFPAGQDSVMHTVELEPGSRIAKAMDAERPMGASYHHQAVRRLGRGLVPVAWAPDGMIEALEHELGWCVAVQWHPEETAEDDPVQQRLFDSFVEQSAMAR
jgi:putative glutamine amidotransferase